MNGRTFFDTNVLVYLFDHDSPAKQERARVVFAAEAGAGRAVVSTQVLQEFFVSVTRKLARPLAAEAAQARVEDLAALSVVHIDTATVIAAIVLSRTARLSLWDALILEAAARGDCERVLSEDLAHGSTLRGVRIENPFQRGGARARDER